MATDPNDFELTDEQRRLLAERANKTGRPVEELLNELLGAADRVRRAPREGVSMLDVMQARGMVGAMEGPGDLSTNPRHMEGFGESRGSADSD